MLSLCIGEIHDKRLSLLSSGEFSEETEYRTQEGQLGDASAHFASTKDKMYDENNWEINPWGEGTPSKTRLSRKEQLVLAGALVVAELERLYIEDLVRTECCEFVVVHEDNRTEEEIKEDAEKEKEALRKKGFPEEEIAQMAENPF